MYELYKYNNDLAVNATIDLVKEFDFEVLKPSLLKICPPNITTQKNTKFILSSLYWYLITFGQYKVYCVKVGSKHVHTCYCLPKCYKYTFMKKGDFILGPAITSISYRGKGLAPYTYSKIIDDYKKLNNNVYMIIHSTNLSSQRAANKAGFTKINTLKKSRILKISRISENRKSAEANIYDCEIRI